MIKGRQSRNSGVGDVVTRRSAARRGGRPYRRQAERLRATSGVCHLCGGAIDPELRSPHPMSFSVDHIVPLSMGGDLHDPANLAPAHRLCNMKRGTGGRVTTAHPDRSGTW